MEWLYLDPHCHIMNTNISKLSASRKTGRFQTDAQHNAILEAAEALFLQKGLAAVTMIDIAGKAGITKITLYRYFSNRDEIALEIQARMMNRIAACIPADALVHSPENVKKAVHALISNFEALRDAYRFVALYYQSTVETPLDDKKVQWTREKLPPLLTYEIISSGREEDAPMTHRINTLLSMTIWSLENLSLRGELIWNDGISSMQDHLNTIEEMMMFYIDGLLVAGAT